MSSAYAFTRSIAITGSGSGENNLVNQTSPAWVLTFVRWNIRDTLRVIAQTGLSSSLLQTREQLVVENDCVQVSVNVNKSVLTDSMSATLVETDVNYETEIAPGDFVFVNMLNWEADQRRIALIARSKKAGPINGPNDGFKGVFKVQSVRKNIVVEPATGVKRVFYKITGYAFTEFNNCIYYNPYLRRDNQGSDKDNLLFSTNLESDYAQLININTTLQDILKALIQSFIGVGISDQGSTSIASALITANTHFYMPRIVGTFLGISGVQSARDIYNYLFGIQQYSGSASQTLAQGMNPSNIAGSPSNRFYYTGTKCEGQTILRASYWEGEKAWSILNQYTNSPLNELYTCFRISPENKVLPTVVFRQIPFTSELFGTAPFNISANVTRFLSLPRWQISNELVFSSDLGRDEAARTNFLQYYAQPPTDIGKPDGFISAQISAGNYVYDVNDVMRSGLRPYVVTTSFQEITATKDEYVAKRWAYIVGDSVIGLNLKLNGSLNCAGIVEPITVGDNLEYDGAVYHIEEVTHICNIDPNSGIKQFRTNMRLSNGVLTTAQGEGLAYPEMIHTNAYRDRQASYNHGQALPGVSEEQDTTYRPTNPSPSAAEVNAPDNPFIQPGQTVPAPGKNNSNSNGGNNNG